MSTERRADRKTRLEGSKPPGRVFLYAVVSRLNSRRAGRVNFGRVLRLDVEEEAERAVAHDAQRLRHVARRARHRPRRDVIGDDVDQAADGVGTVQQRGRSADDFDAGRAGVGGSRR